MDHKVFEQHRSLGRWPASDGGEPVNEDASYANPIASRLAPAMIGGVHRFYVQQKIPVGAGLLAKDGITDNTSLA